MRGLANRVGTRLCGPGGCLMCLNPRRRLGAVHGLFELSRATSREKNLQLDELVGVVCSRGGKYVAARRGDFSLSLRSLSLLEKEGGMLVQSIASVQERKLK